MLSAGVPGIKILWSCRLKAKLLESSFSETNPRVPGDSKLSMSQQRVLAAKANCVLSCISKGEVRGTIILCLLLPVRHCMEHCAQSGTLKDTPEADPIEDHHGD